MRDKRNLGALAHVFALTQLKGLVVIVAVTG